MAKEDIALEGWRKNHGVTPQSSGGLSGILSRLKGGVKARVDERVADLNQRIEHPKEWREKRHKEDMAGYERQLSELKLQSKIDKLNASRAKSQNTIRKMSPQPSYSGGGSDAGLFDLGVGGGSGGNVPLFDMGMGGGSGGNVPLFDLGLGSKQKKKRKNKKSKGNGSGIHIHINK